MKRTLLFGFPVFMVVVILISAWIIYRQPEGIISLPSSTPLPQSLAQKHIVGGFGLDSPDRAANASTNGIRVAFQYGTPPTVADPLGQKLKSLNMKVIDGFISSHLTYYECHRTLTVKRPAPGQPAFCTSDEDPTMTEQNLLAAIENHLKEARNNQLIVGYWVLDDWVTWDAGSARDLLIKIHALIQKYTPDRPTICGFGGSIELDRTGGWRDPIADNFSPQACDMIGTYIYANTGAIHLPAAYDWSMQDVLPPMLQSLRQRGWDRAKQPFIGIGQAFGGTIKDSSDIWITPTASDIETQSKSFCEQGASGVAFYGWNDLRFASSTQMPMTSTQIEAGVRKGIADCASIWGKR